MIILVTGGAGYIGSHMVRMLIANGHTPLVLDSLEYGHRESLPKHVELIVGDVGSFDTIESIFSTHHIQAVMHFAGYISVAESVKNPKKYFENNFVKPAILLSTMEQYLVKYLIFSSTAAVYGVPETVPIPENHPKNPTNPYGLSKWCFEELLQYYDRIGSIRSISLRYFNAAGASLDGNHGEAHEPEGHIIPLAIQAALDPKNVFSMFGTDYNTPDGTCVRDYIHIEDLCRAHIAAIESLMNGHQTTSYNIGTGKGISNKEIVDSVERLTQKTIEVVTKDRRPGDPSTLIADPGRIMKDLGWKPQVSDIDTIINTAVVWHTNHAHGYR